MNASIAAMVNEGLGVLLATGSAVERRRAAGLERPDYVAAIVLSSAVALASTLLAEFSGASAAMDAALGNEASEIGPVVIASYAAAFAAIAAVLVWWGPQLTAKLAALFGGSADRMAAAHWIFLATLASMVITLGVTVADLLFGLFALAAPVAAGYLTLAVALVSLVAIVAISAVLARLICDIAGTGASILFAIVWLCGFVLAAVIGAAPIMFLSGGSGS